MAPAASQARPPVGSGGAQGCGLYNVRTGTSSTVADGTTIIALSGSIYTCVNGTWVKQPGLVYVGNPIGITSPVFTPPPPGQ